MADGRGVYPTSVCLDAKQHDWLISHCKNNRLSVSSVIRRGLDLIRAEEDAKKLDVISAKELAGKPVTW